MIEQWKQIPGYEGYYEISSIGNYRSVDRTIISKDGKTMNYKGRIRKFTSNKDGYLRCILIKDGKYKKISAHQLVAMAFLGHKVDGMNMIVHHENNIKTDNRVENLIVISQRENSHTHHIGSSKYKGVGWSKGMNKWRAYITINNIYKHIGYFKYEFEAFMAYEKQKRLILS